MNPYRPLFVTRECPPSRPGSELAGLAIALIVLGALRVVPAFAAGERAGAEVLGATAMIVIGLAALVFSYRRRSAHSASQMTFCD